MGLYHHGYYSLSKSSTHQYSTVKEAGGLCKSRAFITLATLNVDTPSAVAEGIHEADKLLILQREIPQTRRL